KEIKAEFKQKFSDGFDRFYPVRALKEKGMVRGKCSACGRHFWSLDSSRKVCGNSSCVGGFLFIGNSPCTKQFDYLEAWQAFDSFFKKKGYLSVPRKPVVARWRPDVYWVGASIYGFQPYVVSGEIRPPSNAVIIPQLSLRFNDIENVGITGSHYVCFNMMGQLHFEPAREFDQERYFSEYLEWIVKGMGVPEKELVVHEDAWAGGGNFGPCMEFFSRGLEIGNQVYMNYQVTETGYEELKIKVLDMGQGHERMPWLSVGKSSSYLTTFPTVVERVLRETGFKVDESLMQRFLPYASWLNVDEAEDLEGTWNKIALMLKTDVSEMKEKVMGLAAVYAISEHLRASLVALHDGALPSNAGGGYNLRTIVRRAMDLREKYGWSQLDFLSLMEEHARYLKPMYPELTGSFSDVSEIFKAEEERFHESKEKSSRMMESLVSKPVDANVLVELYDSHGITPQVVKQEFAKRNKSVEIPSNFYSLVTERHAKSVSATATHKTRVKELEGLPATHKLYFDDWKFLKFNARVVAVFGQFLVLDQTAFYPTSGGQEHDTGFINGVRVSDVFKQDEVIVHVLEGPHAFNVNDPMEGIIDFDRRHQLTQHHSAAHVLNGVSRRQLGPHVWQAGAAKTMEKGRLDITHYRSLTEAELQTLEKGVQEVIAANLGFSSQELLREEAEDRYGMIIYQGGFIPGRKLRIVTVEGLDVEACGGTHVHGTREIASFKIISSSRIQDGVVRINYVCGKAAESFLNKHAGVMEQCTKLLNCSSAQLPGRVNELFAKWKESKKRSKSGAWDGFEWELKSVQVHDGSDEERIALAAKEVSTQPEHLLSTLTRFQNDLKQWKEKAV
ncbi:MAG: alanine--tRNA ligase, partial [Candidatus Diapherotrites archaeon]|nr:alanine--tRNA ligase [Candidatus Diapherotrites archaeon]